MEEEDKEKHERSSSNVDAILEDVIKGGFEDKGIFLKSNNYLWMLMLIDWFA